MTLEYSLMENFYGGPFGVLLAGLGLGAFYAAVIWVNVVLATFLTPLFLMPIGWVQSALTAKKQALRQIEQMENAQ